MIITNLLTNMVVLALNGTVPTNTPAFQDYAMRTMLTNAQVVAAGWHLDPTPIATNKITKFKAIPHDLGLDGHIFFDQRYYFTYRNGWFVGFSDDSYDLNDSMLADKDKTDASNKNHSGLTNILSSNDAKTVAYDALQSIGIDIQTVAAASPSIFLQNRFQKTDQKSTPVYSFVWRSNRWSFLTIDISAVSGRIVNFDNSYYPLVRMKMPDNYLKMIGFPANTIFVRPRYTNSPNTQYEVIQPAEITN